MMEYERCRTGLMLLW